MMDSETPEYDEAAAIALIQSAGEVRGRHETVVRETLIAGFVQIFPLAIRPWWVERHIRGAEQFLRFRDVDQKGGYADSVVGLTAIEYESDLTDRTRFRTGKHQVRQYCTGLLNTGADPSRIRGVLSDGVEWRAYEVINTPDREPGTYLVADVELRQVGETLTCQTSDPETALRLVRFLKTHYGREGTRPLTASSVAEYLDLDRGLGVSYLAEFDGVVRRALASDHQAAELIDHIWTTFVAYLSADTENLTFDIDTYVQEFYLITLAKLMCANVIEQRALRSNDQELDSILSGGFFEDRGLHRLVEHDYFGWLMEQSHVEAIRPLARLIQSDLAAYDFGPVPEDDLFGDLLAALAQRTQRILLGQERTPKVIADAMAEALFERLDDHVAPRFLDMCCGSGSMLVATTERARHRLAKMEIEPGTTGYLEYLVNTCTGFDIDPLAVVLAKVNWVQTNRAVLEPFDGSRVVSLPVFHADSLFALSPVFARTTSIDASNEDYQLCLFDKELTLPMFLVVPGRQAFFDALLTGAYGLSHYLAGLEAQDPKRRHVEQILDDAQLGTEALELTSAEKHTTRTFLAALIRTLADLKRDGRDSVWVFVIRNAYWPRLVAGQFNGLISNPPWLALSKVGNNPLATALTDMASLYSLQPLGSSFLHLEMATVFLAHSISHYLADGGQIACVLPDTIRNGTQHHPFRAQVMSYKDTSATFNLAIDEMWTVRKEVFKNRAVVLLGTKASPRKLSEIPGHKIPAPIEQAPHFVVESADRLIWSPNPQGYGVAGAYHVGVATQGADIMPRRLVFFNVVPATHGRSTITGIEPDSEDWYLWSDAKKHCQFHPTTRTISSRYVHQTYISKHLAPFALSRPSRSVLPVVYSAKGWQPVSELDISLNPQAAAHFTSIIQESDFGSLDSFWRHGINFRSKLSLQAKSVGMWVAVYGAGGGIPAAAYFNASKEKPQIIDQTLYWVGCASEEEAIYFCGVVNSPALLERIVDYLPEGAFGDRHLHTLPARAVPEYDPANARHMDVLEQTRAVISELHDVAQTNEVVASYLTTHRSMTYRRRKLREVITTLDSYNAYCNACAALY